MGLGRSAIIGSPVRILAFDPNCKYAPTMARTDEKVRYAPEGKPFDYTPQTAALSAQNVIRVLEGRWKLVILFQLFRQLQADGVVARIVHPQVPPKVEYHLTEWGQSLCPVLDKLLSWAEAAPADVRDRLIESDRSAANAQG